MVSVQENISSTQRKMIPEIVSSANKRKWDGREVEENFNATSQKTISFFDIDFNLQKSLPLDWKQCLDIQSGDVHYYNTRTTKRSCKDPRESPEKLNDMDGPMSLDLELNLLPYDSPRRKIHVNDQQPDSLLSLNSLPEEKKSCSSDLKRCISWMSFDEDQKEMVAAVCIRCHMLVMLCKSSPACPNCKFMHPPHQSPKGLFSP